jgi:hypothetical protein
MSNTTDTFSNPVTQVPVMGLTSTITEEVNVGRDQFMSAYEDPLGAGWVFQIHLDVNYYLAGVSPPENESIAGIAMGDTRVSFDQVGTFEAALKANWATMTSVNGVPLTEQVRLFLADFFDKNKELNAIVATNAADADASAIAYLDSAKITSQLTSFTQATGTSSYEPVIYADGTLGTTLGEFVASSGKPKDTTSLCANLLSVRQVVQVLEAYAALGVGGSNSRVIRVGDSIIGECTIVDSDAANVGSQYKTALPVKVQLVQTAFGAFDVTTDLSSLSITGSTTSISPLIYNMSSDPNDDSQVRGTDAYNAVYVQYYYNQPIVFNMVATTPIGAGSIQTKEFSYTDGNGAVHTSIDKFVHPVGLQVYVDNNSIIFNQIFTQDNETFGVGFVGSATGIWTIDDGSYVVTLNMPSSS